MSQMTLKSTNTFLLISLLSMSTWIRTAFLANLRAESGSPSRRMRATRSPSIFRSTHRKISV